MKHLQYTIQEKELKGMGYIFNNKNYKTYRLEVEQWSYTILLYVMGKMIIVNDWHQHTYNVLEFYKANRDSEKFTDEKYIRISLNRDTGDIFLNTRWEELNVLMKNQKDNIVDNDLIQEFNRKYIDNANIHIQEIYLYKDKMDKIISEIEKLNPIVQ